MKRMQTVGLLATLAAVAVLAGSLVWGLRAEPAGEARGGAAARVRRGERVRVEVLNGAGRAGLARLATQELRGRGFDVVYFGNARAPAGDSSVVLARAGRPDQAREVAAALRIARVRSQPDTSLYLEVTVVLGRDWRPGEVPLPLGGALAPDSAAP